MPNTLTGLIPTLYESMNIVAREMVGFIPAVTRDANATRAAVGQTVRVPVAAVAATQDVTPGVTAPNAGDATIGFTDITITKSRAKPVRWTGEEQRGFATNGQLANVLRDQFAEAMRALVNEMEDDLAIAAKVNASRVVGTAGTTPFATSGNMDDLALVRQILEDNGAPTTDLQFVGNSNTWANLRGKQSTLFKVNEAGTDQMLREGMTDRLFGFAMRNSGGIRQHTAGAGTGYLVNNASGEAVGDTAITVDTGTGTILAGDIISFAADTANRYIAKADLAANTLTLGKPGLRVAIPDNNAITRGAAYRGNFAFARSALVLVQRTPALPDGGDMADDRISLTDPVSGITFEVAVYRQYRQVYYEVAATWGVAAPNEAYIATLLG